MYVDENEIVAKVTMNTEYKQACIEIHNKFWKEPEREQVICHELCHCVVQPLIELACRSANGAMLTQQDIDWHKENVTQHFANAIYYK